MVESTSHIKQILTFPLETVFNCDTSLNSTATMRTGVVVTKPELNVILIAFTFCVFYICIVINVLILHCILINISLSVLQVEAESVLHLCSKTKNSPKIEVVEVIKDNPSNKAGMHLEKKL